MPAVLHDLRAKGTHDFYTANIFLGPTGAVSEYILFHPRHKYHKLTSLPSDSSSRHSITTHTITSCTSKRHPILQYMLNM